MSRVRRKIRSMVKGVRHSLLTHRPGSLPSIAVFAVRRGGSSVLAEMIASEKGMWYANEPFAVFPDHENYLIKKHWLPELRHSQFFDLSEDHRQQVTEYVTSLLGGAVPIGDCLRPKSSFHFDRVTLKILNAPFLMDWFAEAFSLQAIFLVRHPAPQALSVLRNKWGYSAEAYLEKPQFLETIFSEDLIEYARQILATGTDWQKAILNWVIETYHPLFIARSPCLRLTHEQLVLDPERVVQRLCSELGLTDPGHMLEIARRPSSSSRMSTAEHRALIESKDRSKLVSRWQEVLDDSQVRAAQEILDRFEIDIYRMDDPLPRADYLEAVDGEPR